MSVEKPKIIEMNETISSTEIDIGYNLAVKKFEKYHNSILDEIEKEIEKLIPKSSGAVLFSEELGGRLDAFEEAIEIINKAREL